MKKIINLFKKPRIKMLISLSLLLFLYTSICAISYAETVSSNLSDSVFRLHVLANSNSNEDQNLKYIVRDNLLSYMNDICSNCTSKEEAIKLVEEYKDEFRQIAINTIKEQGYSYNVDIKIGNFQFPTKNYGDISLPAGYYDALRVEIGEAEGQNWWCVMFPSLCFIDVSSGIVPEDSKEKLKDNLSDEEYSIVSDKSDIGINFKFKLLEFLGNRGILTSKNN